jgi:plastocyanin
MMRKLGILALGTSMLAVAAGLMACGDDDDGDDGDGGAPAVTRPAGAASPVAGEPTAGGAAPTAAAGGDAIGVTATDFQFTPDTFVAPAGEAVTVQLVNGGSAPHTLTVYADAEYTEPVEGADTGRVSGGGAEGSFEVTFDAAGERFFRCEVHPGQMQGTITVQ